MSATGYRIVKEHPYRHNKALQGHLLPSPVAMPGYAFEAVPFRWLSRQTFETEIFDESVHYDPYLEEQAHRTLGYTPAWIMDGRNQRAVMERFFEPVDTDDGLVFIYLKHSPLQEESGRRLLVGAARITGVQLPPMWQQSGHQPFDSSMWETTVTHSLRPEQTDGFLMPYQALVGLLDEGRDVSGALAWAPEDKDVEFSYVTEHVSDDTAIAALTALRAAADTARDLGVSVAESGLSWLDQQVERLWQLRGPTPGLASALGYLGVRHAHRVARAVIDSTSVGADPWVMVQEAFNPATAIGRQLTAEVPPTVGAVWRAMDDDERNALVILSAMDISQQQLTAVFTGQTTVPVTPAELVENPYYAAICTYRSIDHVSFSTVDRACYPAPHVTWANVIRDRVDLSDPGDRRRCEAVMVEVLESLAVEGDTLAGEDLVIARAAEIPVAQAFRLTPYLLRAHGLDARTLSGIEHWSPIMAAEFADGRPAYKLLHLVEVKDLLADLLGSRRDARRFTPGFDARALMDAVLPQVHVDGEEELARAEKAAGLAELYSSRLSVLVGPAGTGKTTLLRALVDLPDVKAEGLYLLAPTGKARVQLQSRVQHTAHTLASFLIKKGGYDPDSGRYTPVERAHQVAAGLVVIDEASMLTEEMLASALSAFSSIQRLVLVGDYRQLPPIGAGRPFVDVVEWLRPESFGGGIRVAPGYVELTVFRRQQASGDDERDDLALARWFGDGDLPGSADEIWQKLRSGEDSPTVCYRSWKDGDVVSVLMTALDEELGILRAEDKEKAFKLSYGAVETPDGKWINWNTGKDGAGDRCERWQILSPTRSRIFGTTELNRHLKRELRGGDLAWARRSFGFRPPRPMGPEQIVMGDKVMQTVNESHRKAYPSGSGMDYVANGEIGVVIGRAAKWPKFANVEFSSQIGASYGYWPSAVDDPPLELAWAVTVHKSQGSEFGTTFLVIPAKVQLSRELIYTALTRQRTKVVILHEGEVEGLKTLASPSMSESARRLTDLFRAPEPREVTTHDGLKRFDGNLIHVAPGDVMVRSKNEVILAGIFESVAPGRWEYERPITGLDGVTKYPDFTIETLAGERVVWEHLGMMNNPRYAADWSAKKTWYIQQGYRPYDDSDAGGERGVLVWTEDTGGVDQPAWLALAESVLGSTSARPRRPTKKTAPPRQGRP